MKATARTIAAITIAEPRSVCARQVAGGEPGEQDQRLEAAPDVGEVVLAAHEQVGGEDHEGELEELRRLHREVAERRSTLGRRSASRRSARTGRASRRRRPRERGTARRRSQSEVDAEGDEQTHRADPGPHQLAVEEEVRAPPALRLGLRRRRQHHHEAEHDEHDDDDGDDVEADRRRPSWDVPEAHPLACRAAPADRRGGRRSGVRSTCSRCNASWRRSRSGRFAVRRPSPRPPSRR